MRRGNLVVALAIGVMIPLMSGENSSAQSLSVSREIRIRTQVLPAHTIILDNRGNIDEIISNTTDKVKTPKVYTEKVTKETAIPLSPELYTSYQQLISKVKPKVGILYKKSAIPVSAPRHKDVKAYLFAGKGRVTHQSSLVSLSRM